jgi:hypothetical protein
MHSCITALLLILASLSSALEISDPHQPSLLALHSPTAPVSTCLERFTTYYYASYNYVFFHDAADPDFHFTIVTSHMKFYPATLAQWLREKKFSVAANSHVTDDWLCGWHLDRPVVVDDRRHGAIGWKRNDLRSKSDVFDSGNSSSLGKVYRSHVHHDGPIKPSHLTMIRAEAILRDNAPWADIYYMRCTMLGVACGILGSALAWYGLLCVAALRRQNKKLKASTDAGDIELDQIKVHGLSGSGGMQRMHDGAPGLDMHTIKAARSRTEDATTSVADPPPIYTLDGAGPSAVRPRDMV